VLAALPPGASRVLDVGCGDGILAADLVDAGVSRVVALDVDGHVLERARARFPALPIEWVHGDLLHTDLEPDSFDAVVSVAALHQMNAEAAVVRCAHLVRPGGVVVVVGLAAAEWWDMPFEAVALASRTTLCTIRRDYWQHSAPQCWPPPLTYREMKGLGARLLPGARFRRHLLGRYSLVWRKAETR
jgi:SAM-dependent methyltransferase